MVYIPEMSSKDLYGALGAPGSRKGNEPKITYATVMQVICID